MHKVIVHAEYNVDGFTENATYIHVFFTEAEARSYILGVQEGSIMRPKITLNGKEV